MKVKMLTALVGPEINHQAGDIVETAEATRWIEAGIAEPVRDEPKIETAAKPLAKEKAATRTKKAV